MTRISEDGKMKKPLVVIIIVFVSFTNLVLADAFGTPDFGTFDIDFVPISGSTNPTSGQGIVNKDYRMGTKEITNAQWYKFKGAYGAVTGTPSYAYDQNPSWPGSSVPTNCVSWYEAAQFVNWLNTSKGYQAAYKFTNEIHTSFYTLGVWSSQEADGTNLYRNKNAKYFLPTENEWVKAAYWNGTNLQYYATIGNVYPTQGNGSNGGWNYGNTTGQPWAVGSGSQELNGTYDMMGNVWEWMESPWSTGEYSSGSYRLFRGVSFYDDYVFGRQVIEPYDEFSRLGFRIASIPEPASLLLLGLGGLLIRYRK
jgi:formylglycine-generating enzyme required for sulfatase activity